MNEYNEGYVDTKGGECEICGHPECDHSETGCNWKRRGALRMCNCPGYKEKKGREVNESEEAFK